MGQPVDEKGRILVNDEGEVDVVRTNAEEIPVQLPLSAGDVVEIDLVEERFIGFDGDNLKFADPDDEWDLYDKQKPLDYMVEEVHHFNTRVRDADRVEVISKEEYDGMET